jgi:hypothetical protein
VPRLRTHAIAIRRADSTLALFLRVVRSTSGIYVVFAAGQPRSGHDPHASWHVDGRVHHKSFSHEVFPRRRRQPLGSFSGVEPFVVTSTTRADTPYLPDCNPSDFDAVTEIPVDFLNDPPTGTQVHVELLGPGAQPVLLPFEHRLLQRAVIDDGTPTIAVSIYDVPIPKQEL